MRKVTVYKWEKTAGNTYNTKVEVGKAVFHQFSMDFEEFETGPANFASAIVELEDGTVVNVEVSMIKFDEPISEVCTDDCPFKGFKNE